ncbi:MAG: SDR family NAD(P)-dependent oxidoreductase [Planktomarina sp.]
MTFKGKKYWIVGASEGLGRALAQQLSAEGAHLILTARNEERLQDLAKTLPGPADVCAADISAAGDLSHLAPALEDLDGVIFMAGVYWPMNAKNWNGTDAITMADINFTGAFRVLNMVMPQFAAKDRGHIIIIGSLSGFRGLPNAVGYSASKAGVMALAESLQCDLRGSGIRVQVANPGFITTRLTDKNNFSMPFIMSPEKAASVVLKHMKSKRFKISFPWGFSLLFRFSQFWPDWLYYRIFKP